MTEIPWTIWLVAALMMGGLTLLMALALWLVMRSLAGPAGGWRALQEHYPAPARPTGASFSGQTVQIGRVVYKNCVTVALAAEGLYLDAGSVMRLFGGRPLLIPWDQFCGERPTTLHWQAAVMLQIGKPEVGTLTVKRPLFQQLEPFLRSRICDAEIVVAPAPA